MKLADYIAQRLADFGMRHIFVLSGGASLHLIHAIADHGGIEYVCNLHEQASAMSADGYSRITNRPTAVVATSGPGATNLLTGVCSAYYDSVPMLVITGQVATFRAKGATGVRQLGFQETDTIEIFRSVTKYCSQISDKSLIRYELEKAIYLATSGRPGPVLLDIPDDLQRAEIDPESLVGFPFPVQQPSLIDRDVSDLLVAVSNAKRPVLVVGWGVRLANAADLAIAFARTANIPVAPTWAVADILPSGDPLRIGTFGTHGTRFGNFAVQNADLILSVGCRLDTKATGSPATTFARGARKFVVDIDPAELGKFESIGIHLDGSLQADARCFFETACRLVTELPVPTRTDWHRQIETWKSRYSPIPVNAIDSTKICPYQVVKTISSLCVEKEIIVLDTGCTLAWTMQAFEPKIGQRMLHDCNNTAMGWAIPASIGASLASQKARVICLTGDGSLAMNIQELATIRHLDLPIKIIVFNNHGHSMIRQTQDQWLGGVYHASSPKGGVADPDYGAVAKGFGFPSKTIFDPSHVRDSLEECIGTDGSFFLNLEIDSRFRVNPQVRYGRPNEDAEPLLPRNEFFSNMIVPAHLSSQTS